MGPRFRLRVRLDIEAPAGPPVGYPVMAGGNPVDPAATRG